MADLTTTNVLLGIMAVVSLLQGLAVVALLGGAFLLYRRLMRFLGEIEQRQIAPMTARVNAILDDLKDVSATVRSATTGAGASLRVAIAWLLRRARRR